MIMNKSFMQMSGSLSSVTNISYNKMVLRWSYGKVLVHAVLFYDNQFIITYKGQVILRYRNKPFVSCPKPMDKLCIRFADIPSKELYPKS